MHIEQKFGGHHGLGRNTQFRAMLMHVSDGACDFGLVDAIEDRTALQDTMTSLAFGLADMRSIIVFVEGAHQTSLPSETSRTVARFRFPSSTASMVRESLRAEMKTARQGAAPIP